MAHWVQWALQTKVEHHPLSMVIAPDISGQCFGTPPKMELENSCLVEAACQFTQVQHTPFLTPLLELFSEKV